MLEELQQSKLVHDMEEYGRMGAYEVDVPRRRWKASARFLEMFRLPVREEFSYEDFTPLIHPADLEQVQQQFRESLETSPVFNSRYRCIVQGQERIIETRSRIERDSEGNPLRVLGFCRDITEERQLQAVFEAAPSGMLLVDEHRKILLVNREIERIFGYSRQELTGQSIEILLPERYRANHPSLVASYMQNPTQRSMGEGRDLSGKRKDGSEVPVEVGLHPVYVYERFSVICSIVDISERRRIAEREARQKKELRDFAYRIAHDIRNPLANLKSLLELSSDSAAAISNEEARSMMTSITADLIQFTEEIIGATLAAPGESVMKPLSVDALQERISQRFQYPLRESGGSIHWTTNHDSVPSTPPGVMEEVIGNLISNALRYSQPDRKPEIQVRTWNDNSRFHLSVEDNGPGIPEDSRQQVFSIFGRLQDKQGTGLGLYLVKENLNRLGGSIDFSSSSAGTIFQITLPLN